MPSVKIGISGADSTGKSNFIQALIHALLVQQVPIKVLSIGDIARRSPYPLVERQTINSSFWILGEVQKEETVALQGADYLICDRTVLDIWVFTHLPTFSAFVSEEDMVTFDDAILKWLKTYNLILITSIDPTIPIKWENLPSNDSSLRERFQDQLFLGLTKFKGSINELKLPNLLDERIELVLDLLRQYNSH